MATAALSKAIEEDGSLASAYVVQRTRLDLSGIVLLTSSLFGGVFRVF